MELAGTWVTAQGGGRKGQSAIDQAMQHIIKTKIVHLQQNPSIDLYLDLHTCFDLIVEMCHHGAEDAYLCLHAKTHQAMRYYICHKFGV